jgi:hypothetical protein
MYKDKEVNNVNIFFVNVWRKNIFDIYVTEYGTALTTILPILFLYLNTVTVTAGRDGIYYDKILVSEYKLFKRSNKVNLLIALVQ